jgi:hypothetical protein
MGIQLQALVDQLDAICQGVDVLTAAAEQLFLSHPSAIILLSPSSPGQFNPPIV